MLLKCRHKREQHNPYIVLATGVFCCSHLHLPAVALAASRQPVPTNQHSRWSSSTGVIQATIPMRKYWILNIILSTAQQHYDQPTRRCLTINLLLLLKTFLSPTFSPSFTYHHITCQVLHPLLLVVYIHSWGTWLVVSDYTHPPSLHTPHALMMTLNVFWGSQYL